MIGVADRKLYTVVIGGVEHTMMLDESDAQRLDAQAVEVSDKAMRPANKARTPKNK